MTRIASLLALCLAASLGATAPPLPQGKSGGSPGAPSRAKPAARAGGQNLPGDLQVIDLAEYKKVLSVHTGRPLVVSFWATWCEPCRDEYPLVNELARKYMPQGLDVIGISLDDDADRNLVRHFLAKMQPVFFNYRKKPGDDDTFIRAIDPRWRGAIPATAFYGRDGKLVRLRVGESIRAQFEKDIQELLHSPRS
jgi:thiol-disulfide isomerase/thioredoxin